MVNTGNRPGPVVAESHRDVMTFQRCLVLANELQGLRAVNRVTEFSPLPEVN